MPKVGSKINGLPLMIKAYFFIIRKNRVCVCLSGFGLLQAHFSLKLWNIITTTSNVVQQKSIICKIVFLWTVKRFNLISRGNALAWHHLPVPYWSRKWIKFCSVRKYYVCQGFGRRAVSVIILTLKYCNGYKRGYFRDEFWRLYLCFL